MTSGFLTFAQNTDNNDYLKIAYALALSIKATQSDNNKLSVVVTPETIIPDNYRYIFDNVIEIPWGDEAEHSTWKLENEWKAYHLTPYQETIKLDADMLFMSDIKDWWNLLRTQNIMMCNTVETYRGEIITSDFYRKCFTKNHLPNIYTGMMYFKICDSSKEFFRLVQDIFQNWKEYFNEFLEPVTRPHHVSTDVVFALAAKILGEDNYTSPLPIPRFVHMKTRLQNWRTLPGMDEDWTKYVPVSFTDDLILKIGRHKQVLPVHYHLKSFIDDKISIYEKFLGI